MKVNKWHLIAWIMTVVILGLFVVAMIIIGQSEPEPEPSSSDQGAVTIALIQSCRS